MNWSHEQTIKAGAKPKIKREDCQVAYDEEAETGHIPQKQLDAGEAAAQAAVAGIPGEKLVTVAGHEAAGEGPGTAHIAVTVSRVLTTAEEAAQ